MNPPYIVLDYAGFGGWRRLTHIPSGDTCLCKPYMTHQQWLEAKQEFLNKYPELAILENGQPVERTALMES